jgi:hypothetical protein
MHLLAIEWGGACFGVLGTILLALNGPRAGWGFVAYLASNLAWIASSWMQGQWPLLTQQIIFLASSLLGIWVWLVQPHVSMYHAVYRSMRLYRGRLQSLLLAVRWGR